jgi:drug/metabolite transporter (DMT)-like permease
MKNATFAVVSLGLMAAVVWGIVDYAGAKAARAVGAVRASYLAYIIGLVLYGIVFALFLRPEVQFDPSVLWYSVTAALFNMCGMVTFYKALHAGPVSIVSPVSSFFPLVSTLVLAVLFGHRLGLWQVLGIVLVVGGAVVASGLLGAKKAEHVLRKGPLLGLVAAGFWGVGFACLAHVVTVLGWELATLLHYSIGFLVLTALLPLTKGKEKIFIQPTLALLKHKYVVMAAICQISGLILLNMAVHTAHNLAAVAVALSSCYPIIAVLLALVKLKERLQPLPFAGAVVGLAGVIILILG